MQLTLTEARKIDADCEVGEEVTDEVHFADFGRRAILNLRQTLASKILELQKDSLYAKYKDKIGHIIAAEVYQVWKKEILLLDDDGNELLLPKSEQIPTDFYRKGETVRAIVQRVDNYNNNPKILLSRTDKVFLQRLFELEVPEINDGLITIKAIARIPGERAKVAVESYDDRIDPVDEQELVPGVFDIMLVIGIVYDALQVAFIVAYLHLQFKDIIRFHFIQKCFFVSGIHNQSGNADNISGRNTLFSVG